jgi:hypothetical protein
MNMSSSDMAVGTPINIERNKEQNHLSSSGASGIAYKNIDLKNTKTYKTLASHPITKAILEGKRENMRTYGSDFSEFDMTGYAVLQKKEAAIIEIKRMFASLGYKMGDLKEPYISTDVLKDFQNLCGIYKGDGQLIGKDTLEALIIAKETKIGWKKAVAGLNDEKQLPTSQNIKETRQKLEGLQFIRDGFNLNEMDPKMQDLLKQAYSALGFRTDGGNLIVANYKLQILSGVNEDKNLSKVYGPATNKALVEVLKAVEQNLNWRDRI